MENCNQYPTMLKNCTQVHVGPRIEIHSEESKASCLKKEDEESNEMFNNSCQKLKNKYITYFSYMRSFLWEGKRNDFPLKDYFVELIVEKADLFGKKSGERIRLNEIFSIEKDGHQTILVTGDPGYGKSTLCKKIAYDWASTNYLQRFDLTLIVLLRELGDKSVTDALLDNIHGHSLMDKDWILQNRQLNILVILDGFDEVVEKNKIMKFIREESFDISHRMTIVVTSRPQEAEEMREDMKMRFSIEGFSPGYQEKYIELMFRKDETKANELISKLNENDFYREIAECPLMLHMLCCLHQNEEMKEIETITDLYIRIFSLIVERYVRKNNQNGKFERGKYFIGDTLLIKLGNLIRSKFRISSSDLKKYFANKDEHNFIVGLDILTLDSFSECDNIIRYSFVHRTFGDFLSALSIYIGDVSFPYFIYELELLFLLGFYKNESFPKKFLKSVEKKFFTAEFMLHAHQQIKLETNWKQFCSHSNIKCYFWNICYFQKLMQLYRFKEFYLHLGDSENEYKKVKEALFDSLCDCNSLNTLSIYLVLSLKNRNLKYIRDIREPVSCIINFLHAMKTSGFDISFIGLELSHRHPLEKFTNVNYNLNLPDNILNELNVSENEKLVGLQTVDMEDSKSYLLSLEQYEDLRGYIKFHSTGKQNSKCVIM
ncbi:NACHT, LRR and PYD domains-containing protein 9-like isoform X2 [Centruroides sculpturatus]|uniref:NACHT, LRR and PYD domains-containing protein 9-like isoform X2 n=1 Tax=Centruroides sculpturatus TaxID=218467 RepID=UPI000C6E3EEC|nr:NACHT, LRR and PYD domains-containing protein 9-like isoform X2 [Centruroides sculpturatus]XP_023242459.1 NACHT, LRR and PYD domains-containing protein 9-like isoform X2 [Centruroides sculpturatus]